MKPTMYSARQMAETPLHQAADYSQLSMAALLLSHGADPNKQQGDGDTPLHHAAFRGDARMVGLLLGSRADPNVRNFMFGRTPLHYAVDCGHVECVRLLIAAGADVRLVDKVQPHIVREIDMGYGEKRVYQSCISKERQRHRRTHSAYKTRISPR